MMLKNMTKIVKWMYCIGFALMLGMVSSSGCQVMASQCRGAADCLKGQVCAHGWCRPSGQDVCKDDGTCPKDLFCVRGLCLAGRDTDRCELSRDARGEVSGCLLSGSGKSTGKVNDWSLPVFKDVVFYQPDPETWAVVFADVDRVCQRGYRTLPEKALPNNTITLIFERSTLHPGTYRVEEDIMRSAALATHDYKNAKEYVAKRGTITITSFKKQRSISGTFSLSFPKGSVEGSFQARFCSAPF